MTSFNGERETLARAAYETKKEEEKKLRRKTARRNIRNNIFCFHYSVAFVHISLGKRWNRSGKVCCVWLGC